ncbi:SDR family oxidoreductase [Bradyrhizobium sp. 153]|uniref:SDR family oxidoreductase n=1 Tax=Bradyrhizobium sp. 153 TaxID=2782627 RepID=UPI001FF722AA|nr:SDR family oxidoreductase [Bradyrhizobium sp. 153]MCK1668937.1 SDR family oxidoreductase [Bradyrhizobium sp. 153]
MTAVLITGANRGIGLALARQYAADAAEVIVCCRDPARAGALKELAASSGGRVRILPLDVADENSITSLKNALGDQSIDILINNAGIVGPEHQSADLIDAEGWMATLRVNALAPMLIALALRENLKRGSEKKLVAISSGLGSTGREPRSALNPIRYAYCASKAALNNGMHALSRDWAADGVLVAILAPGYVRTDMGGSGAVAHPTSISPEESASALIQRIAKLTPATSGTFQDHRGDTIAW